MSKKNFNQTLKIEGSTETEIQILHQYENMAQIRIKTIDRIHPIEEKMTLFHLTKTDAMNIIHLLNDFVSK